MKKAFSLVEILVALIIVSLITAALAPVITKKLSSAGITIVGGGSGGGNTETQWGEPRNQSDCDPYNALYIPKEWNGGEKSVCVTKYNAGDSGGPDIAPGTSIVQAGVSCSSGNCCWQGQTASPCTSTDSHGSTYSGCYRTACDFTPAKKTCELWAPSPLGVQVKTWRLPKASEQQGWSDRINSTTSGKDGIVVGMGADGLQPCVYDASYCTGMNHGSNICGNNMACKGNSDSQSGDCDLDVIWNEDGKGFSVCNNAHVSTGEYASSSIRCVTDNVPYPETIGASGSGSPTPVEPSIKTDCSSIDSNCQLCTSSQCITCKQGYVMGEDGKCEESDEIIKYVYPNEPKTNGDCEKYNALFISKAFTGSGRNVCMSRYNSGDTDSGYSTSPKGPTIPASIKLTNVGSSCDAVNEKCCWKGVTTTSGGCTAPPSGTYSGCNRTVCNYAAAKEICDNYAPSGTNKGDWRLPNTTEMLHIALRVSGYISDKMSYAADDFIQKNASNGLMFCDGNTETEGSALCVPSSTCLGAVSNTCYAYLLWTGDQLEKEYFAFRLQYGNLRGPAGYQINHAFSTRCVYDPPGVPAGETNTGLLISTQCSGFDSKCQMCMGDKCLACKAGYVLNEDNTCTKYEPEVNIVTDKKYLYPNQPKNQAECDQWNSLFMHGEINGIGRNTCITKYNPGDNDNGWSANPKGPTIPSTVTVVPSTSTCDSSSKPCCWYGTTSEASVCETSYTSALGATSSYTGCNRTLCNQTAAEEICSKWAPSGTNAGDWRILTGVELVALSNRVSSSTVRSNDKEYCRDGIHKYCGNKGLQLCEHSPGYGTNWCYVTDNNCFGSGSSKCQPYILGGKDFNLQAAYGFFLGPYYTGGRTTALSYRCVYDPPGILEEDVSTELALGNLVSSNCSKFDEKCKLCTTNSCIKCSKGYTLEDGKCTTWCKGDNIMVVEDLCVTKCNMGDCGLPLSYNYGTCWKPSTSCTNNFSGYSGCSRYLCNFRAAKQACLNATIEGKSGWRLPTFKETANWKKYNNGLGEDGLQFCSYSGSSEMNACPAKEGGCSGSWSDNCVPAVYWTSDVYDSESKYVRIRAFNSNGSHTSGNEYDYYAFSTRCVRELE